jgi:tripartite-type tricarboxylate transporter receptor subunit TctC
MKQVLVALAATLVALTQPALAQSSFPSRGVKIIVPVVPGSFTDLAARALASELAGPLGHSVVVENRPGAGTTVGTSAVAQSDPDGHTLLITENSFTISPALYPRLPYDPINDFAPITLVAEAPYILWSRPSLEARTLKEMVDAAKAKPGHLTFASGGQGTSSHLSAELFFEKAGISVTHIPFKGVGASMTDVMAGRVDFGGSSLASPIGHIRTGKLRPLAVTGNERSAMLPDVPTFAEAGFPGYDAPIWFGVFAPARTPPAAIARIHQELRAAVAKPAIQELFQKQGAKAFTIPSAEFARRIAAETHTWKDLVVRRGIKVE